MASKNRAGITTKIRTTKKKHENNKYYRKEISNIFFISVSDTYIDVLYETLKERDIKC